MFGNKKVKTEKCHVCKHSLDINDMKKTYLCSSTIRYDRKNNKILNGFSEYSCPMHMPKYDVIVSSGRYVTCIEAKCVDKKCGDRGHGKGSYYLCNHYAAYTEYFKQTLPFRRVNEDGTDLVSKKK